MIATLLAVTNPGDEVIIFEPFYENYGPGFDALRRHAASSSRFSLPTGPSIATNCGAPSTRTRKPSSLTRRITQPAKYSRAKSWTFIARLCQEFDALAITDEIYEHILYEGARTSR